MPDLDVSRLIGVHEAIGILDAQPVTPRIVRVPLAEALDRRLAQDVVADRDYPPFAKSLMDGYAVRGADLRGGTAAVELRFAGEIPAGAVPDRPLGVGEAAAIMTGAPLPPGADAVVPVEETERDGPVVQIRRAEQLRPLHRRPRGRLPGRAGGASTRRDGRSRTNCGRRDGRGRDARSLRPPARRGPWHGRRARAARCRRRTAQPRADPQLQQPDARRAADTLRLPRHRFGRRTRRPGAHSREAHRRPRILRRPVRRRRHEHGHARPCPPSAGGDGREHPDQQAADQAGEAVCVWGQLNG